MAGYAIENSETSPYKLIATKKSIARISQRVTINIPLKATFSLFGSSVIFLEFIFNGYKSRNKTFKK